MKLDAVVIIDALAAAGLFDEAERQEAQRYIAAVPDDLPVDRLDLYKKWRLSFHEESLRSIGNAEV